jgi:hypothetical protein
MEMNWMAVAAVVEVLEGKWAALDAVHYRSLKRPRSLLSKPTSE